VPRSRPSRPALLDFACCAILVGCCLAGPWLAGLAIADDVTTAGDSGSDGFGALSEGAESTGLTTEPRKGESISNETAIEVSAGGSSLSQAAIIRHHFERSEDRNFDGFPDGWTRQRDGQHPPYLPIKIVAHDPALLDATQSIDRNALEPWEQLRKVIPRLPSLPPSVTDSLIDHYLLMELDGGAAMMQSPIVALDPNFRYQLSCRVMTQGLRHNHAYAELIFLDSAGTVLRSEASASISDSTPWTRCRTEMAAPPDGAVGMAIRLHLTPIQWRQDRDIFGKAGFDDLVVMQVPRVRIDTNHRLALYQSGERPVVRMQVMGLQNQENTARFIAFDTDGREIARVERKFSIVQTPNPGAPADPLGRAKSDSAATTRKSTGSFARDMAGAEQAVANRKLVRSASEDAIRDEGELSENEEIEAFAEWELPELQPGFYTIRSSLIENHREWLRTETTVAVLAKFPNVSTQGPFGWTMPDGVGNIDVKSVPQWLESTGVFLIKYPFWIDINDRTALDNAAWLTERLKEAEIRCIGLLATPPPAIQSIIDERDKRQPVAANLFRDARIWQPLLEPIMTRLTIRVPTWQLGHDGDHSFIGRPQLPEVIRGINRDLQGYGQPIGVAISWPWLETLPPAVGTVASAVNRSTDEPLTADELEVVLQQIAMEPRVAAPPGKTLVRQETWLTLNPLNKKQYDRDARIGDLLLRMGTVRGHAVAGAFISNPRDRQHGLLRVDWRPDELYLPWRTASLLLGDVDRIGSIELEEAGSNMVFANPQRTVMMVWNSEPRSIEMYLGDQVKQIDAWGRQSVPEKVVLGDKARHRFHLDRAPIFLVDVDPVIVAMRMATRVAGSRIDSLLGRRQSVELVVRNPTTETLSGTVALVPPEDWIVESPPQSFDLIPGDSRTVGFNIILRNSARIGEVPLEFKFSLRNDPIRRFDILRSITVGPEGLDVEVVTKTMGDQMVVQLMLKNNSSRDQRYDCLLFPPDGRQYQRRQISVPAGTTIRRDFIWDDGASLIGKSMLLRAVEQSGGRILNQSIMVTR